MKTAAAWNLRARGACQLFTSDEEGRARAESFADAHSLNEQQEVLLPCCCVNGRNTNAAGRMAVGVKLDALYRVTNRKLKHAQSLLRFPRRFMVLRQNTKPIH